MNTNKSLSVSSVLLLASIVFLVGVVITLFVAGNQPSRRLAILGASTVRADEGACSLASLGGTYAIQGQGTIVEQLRGFPPPPFPFAETGIVTFDRAGKLFGKTTVTFNGVVLQPTFTGSYTVNSDCTANLTIQSSAGFTLHDDAVVIGGGKRFLSVEPDSFVVITRRAEKLED